MGALEPAIRRFCAEALDPLIGEPSIDFVEDLGKQIPMRAISMLLGIPESDQESIRDLADAHIRTEPGSRGDYTVQTVTGEEFAEYIDWRMEHPSDDLMTALINVEFEDETGTVRKAHAAARSSCTRTFCPRRATTPRTASSAGSEAALRSPRPAA